MDGEFGYDHLGDGIKERPQQACIWKGGNSQSVPKPEETDEFLGEVKFSEGLLKHFRDRLSTEKGHCVWAGLYKGPTDMDIALDESIFQKPESKEIKVISNSLTWYT